MATSKCMKYCYSNKYHIAGKFGEFGESFVIRQTKTTQIGTYTINNLLADLLIRLTFFCQRFKTSQFANLSRYTVYSAVEVQTVL